MDAAAERPGADAESGSGALVAEASRMVAAGHVVVWTFLLGDGLPLWLGSTGDALRAQTPFRTVNGTTGSVLRRTDARNGDARSADDRGRDALSLGDPGPDGEGLDAGRSGGGRIALLVRRARDGSESIVELTVAPAQGSWPVHSAGAVAADDVGRLRETRVDAHPLAHGLGGADGSAVSDGRGGRGVLDGSDDAAAAARASVVRFVQSGLRDEPARDDAAAHWRGVLAALAAYFPLD